MAFVLRVVICILLVSACGEEEETLTLTSFDDLVWPEIQSLPDCEPWNEGRFSIAALAPASGDLRLKPSARLIPTSTIERMEIVVLDAQQNVDTAAFGQLRVVPVEGVDVVLEGTINEGVGSVRVKFTSEGVHRLDIRMENDSRIGSIEVETYTARLPIWELEVASDEFANMLDNASDRIEIDGFLQVDGAPHQTSLRVHGGASRDFPKKSLRFNLEGSTLESGEDKLIVRAEYNDKSMLRTWLGYEYFRAGSVLPTPSSEFIHLRVNQRYYGLMHRVQRIDKQFLATHGLSTNGNLYEADPPTEFAVPGGNLTPLPSEEHYFRTYQWHTGPGAWQDLIEFIEFTLQYPDTLFNAVIATEVNLDQYLSYLALMAVMQNHEHIRKNYYLYRDPEAADTRWIALPWDLDLTMGHLWSEIDDVLDERILVDADVFVGELSPERFGYFNQLTERVLKQPQLRQRFLEIVSHLLNHVVTDEFTTTRLAYAKCLLAPDVLADQSKWSDNDEYLGRVEEINEFWDGRRQYLTEVLRRNGIKTAQ